MGTTSPAGIKNPENVKKEEKEDYTKKESEEEEEEEEEEEDDDKREENKINEGSDKKIKIEKINII